MMKEIKRTAGDLSRDKREKLANVGNRTKKTLCERSRCKTIKRCGFYANPIEYDEYNKKTCCPKWMIAHVEKRTSIRDRDK